MTFSEKLDLLMSLTGTSNSALGRALSYDPSYISRVRAGKRGLPRRQPFLQPASEYFAQAIVSPIQKNAAANLMTAGQPWPDDPADAVPVIHRWLAFSPEDMSEPLDRFFQSLTAPPVTWGTLPQMETPPVLDRDPVFFFGSQGKREAVIRFLSDVCLADSARTLYLFSDEDMDWLFDDAAFSAQWSALLVRFLAAGGTIHIIHTIDRDLGEMLGALQQWIPLYLTGRILPYYCPRLRDGICRRSLFVAPGRSALVSNSIEDKTEGMANLYTRDPRAVEAFELEFSNYLSLCRPLMDIYTPDRSQALVRRVTDFIRGQGPLFSASPIPLPLEEDVPAVEPLRQALLDHLAGGGELAEILHLPDPRAAAAGLPLPLADLLGIPETQCGPQRLRELIGSIPQRMNRLSGYRAILSENLPASVGVLARGQEEVILFSAAPPSTAFVITEPRMTSALWDYLQRAAGPSDQKQTPRRLERWLKAMDKAMKKAAKSKKRPN